MTKEKISIVKIGGNIIEDENALKQFLQLFSKLAGKKILIHGGGKRATQFASKLGIASKMVDGRRITDKETWKSLQWCMQAWSIKKLWHSCKHSKPMQWG